MSVNFPPLRPTERSFTPGAIPQRQMRMANRRIFKGALASTDGGGVLQLDFDNIRDSDANLIREIYRNAKSAFDNVVLPSSVFAGDPELLAFVTATGGAWRFAGPPRIEWAKCGRASVSVELRLMRRGGVLAPPEAVVPPPLPWAPCQQPDPPPIDPPPPEPSEGVTAFFHLTSPDAATGGNPPAQVQYSTGGVIARTDAPGIVATVLGADPGSPHTTIVARDLDCTPVWRVTFGQTLPVNQRVDSGSPPYPLRNGGYLIHRDRVIVGAPNTWSTNLCVVDPLGANPAVYGYSNFAVDLGFVDAASGFKFVAGKANYGTSNEGRLLKLNADYSINQQWSVTPSTGVPGTTDFSELNLELKLELANGDLILAGPQGYWWSNGNIMQDAIIMRVTQDAAIVWQARYICREGNRSEYNKPNPSPEDYYAGGCRGVDACLAANGELVVFAWYDVRTVDNYTKNWNFIFRVDTTSGAIVGSPKEFSGGPDSDLIGLTVNATPRTPEEYIVAFESYGTDWGDGATLVGLDAQFNVKWAFLAASYDYINPDARNGQYFYSYYRTVVATQDQLFYGGDLYFGPADQIGFYSWGAGIYTALFSEIENGSISGTYGGEKSARIVSITNKPESVITVSPGGVAIGAESSIAASTSFMSVRPALETPEKYYRFDQPPPLDGAVPIVPSNIAYSQSSVYPGLEAATNAAMQNGSGNELLQTVTDYEFQNNWIQMDLGALSIIRTITVGADFNGLLGNPGDWGARYTEAASLLYSADGATWFTVLPQPTVGVFTSPLKLFSGLAIAGRYIRLSNGNDYVAATEFTASSNP